MPQRIPMKIFRLKQTSEGVLNAAPTQFVQGVTTADIINGANGRTIRINQTPIGQPLAQPVETVVNSDNVGDFVILDGAQKLYIRQPSGVNIGTVLPDVFEFYVNPQRLSPTYTKIETAIRTRGGWEIQHWGDALTELRIEGTSGGVHRGSNVVLTRTPTTNQLSQLSAIQQSSEGTAGDGLREGQSITETVAWKRLMQLKQLYVIDHAVRNQEQLVLVGIAVYDSFYVGYFTQFSGPNQDANTPYQFTYAFTLKILYETNVSAIPSIASAVTAGTSNNFINSQNLNR